MIWLPLKIFGALLIAASGLMLGCSLSRKLNNRRDFLAKFAVFLNTLATGLRYSGDDIFTLVSLSAGDFAQLQIASRERGLPFEQVWEKKLSAFARQFSLTKQDVTLLKEFGEKLGKTDLEGQLKHIELYRTLFAKQLSQAEEAIAKKARLYKTLGLFGGVSAALMMI